MKKLLVLLLILGGVVFARSDAFEHLVDQQRSKQSLREKVIQKRQELLFINDSFRAAQERAPVCGGVKMKVTMPEETKERILELNQDIERLQKLISAK